MQPQPGQWGQQQAAQPAHGTPQQQYPGQQSQVLGGQPAVGFASPVAMQVGIPTTSAVAALVLSILGLIGCGICTALPGLIMANNALAITNQYPGHPDSGTAKAAQVISWIVIGVTLLIVLFYVGLFALAAFGMAVGA